MCSVRVALEHSHLVCATGVYSRDIKICLFFMPPSPLALLHLRCAQLLVLKVHRVFARNLVHVACTLGVLHFNFCASTLQACFCCCICFCASCVFLFVHRHVFAWAIVLKCDVSHEGDFVGGVRDAPL